MKVLDLYSGTGSWSQAFLNHGHDVLRIDNDERFSDVPNTLILDVLEHPSLTERIVNEFGWPDVILASPPCQAFSLASVRHHFRAEIICGTCGSTVYRLKGEEWQPCCDSFIPLRETFKMTPKSSFGYTSLRLVERTLELVATLQPKFWWMENPRATMQHFIPMKPVTVWWCRYGDSSAKPTHLWGKWPDTWTPRPECHNGNPDHQESRRGSKTGTQGKKNAIERGVIPYELSKEVCMAVEEELR